MDIGKIIKENRTARNMTQEELANEFFVSRPLISKWENGKSYPDLEQLLKLSDFFDLTLDELLRGDKKMTKNFNTSIKRKPILIGVIAILIMVILSSGIFIWSDQSVQLKPSDIEITSVRTEKNLSTDSKSDTGKQIKIPEDVSYVIKYKIKKPFTKVRMNHYFDNDQKNIYVDIRGHHSLFPSNNENTITLFSDAKIYGEDKEKIIEGNYVPKSFKNTDIRIVDVNSVDQSTPHSNIISWLLLKKEQLQK